MKLKNFDYNLPKELIANYPADPKDSSRLMVLKDNKIIHKHFYDLIDYLSKGDVLVINETKVKRCKITGKKESGSHAEFIIIGKDSKNVYKVRITAKNPGIGKKFIFKNGLEAKIIKIENEDFFVTFNKQNADKDIEEMAEYPFPPYIDRDKLSDKEYQPIFAKKIGSVAAPTASLHFTNELLKKIKDKGIIIAKVCLHIDFGTFFKIRTENVEEHKMHSEFFEIDEENCNIINNCKGKIIAVGTTSLRALESASDNNGKIIPKKEFTEIYIYPSYKFKSKTSALITNFHLPKSTLLLLVSAFTSKEKIFKAYNEAIKERYRFFSLGDAMLVFK